MVLLPYDRYQRLMSRATKPETSKNPDRIFSTETTITPSATPQEGDQKDQDLHEQLRPETQIDESKQSPQPSHNKLEIDQNGQGVISVPPPPGIAVKGKRV